MLDKPPVDAPVTTAPHAAPEAVPDSPPRGPQGPYPRRHEAPDGPALFVWGMGWLVGGAVAIAVGAIVLGALLSGGRPHKPAAAPFVPVSASPVALVLTRVKVVTDVATPGLADSAAQKLRAANLTYMGAVADDPLGQYAASRVLVLTKDPAAEALGRKAATALGISQAAVFYTDQPTAAADVIVVLAGDYTP